MKPKLVSILITIKLKRHPNTLQVIPDENHALANHKNGIPYVTRSHFLNINEKTHLYVIVAFFLAAPTLIPFEAHFM